MVWLPPRTDCVVRLPQGGGERVGGGPQPGEPVASGGLWRLVGRFAGHRVTCPHRRLDRLQGGDQQGTVACLDLIRIHVLVSIREASSNQAQVTTGSWVRYYYLM